MEHRSPHPLHILPLVGTYAIGLILLAVAFFVLYWVIRLSVSHALRDHERRQHPPLAAAPAAAAPPAPAHPAPQPPHEATPAPPHEPDTRPPA